MSRLEGERNHPLSLLTRILFNGILKQIVPLIVLFVFLISKLGGTVALGIVVLYLGIVNISFIFSWKYTYFYIKEDKLNFHKGVINKVTRKIPLDKINTIDLSQNLLEQLFRLCRVKIDTESISDAVSEISLIMKEDRAKELQQQLLKKTLQEHSIEEEHTYSVSGFELIRYSLLSNGVMEIIIVLFALQGNIRDLGNLIGLDSDNYFENIQVTVYKIVGMLVLLFTLGFFIVLIKNIIRYTGFKVQIDPDTLYISYGLLEKKKYSFKQKKIKGIHIKQSFLMQWFKKYSLEVESIGYGDESDEKAVLYPYCNEDVKNQIISELLPQLHLENTNIHRPPRESCIYFLFFKVLAAIIITLILAFTLGYTWIGVILITVFSGYGYMAYKNTAMGIEKGLVYMSRGGFTKKQSYIHAHYIQSIGQSYHYLQKQKGICSYSVIVWGGLLKNIKVKHIDNTLFESYVDYID